MEEEEITVEKLERMYEESMEGDSPRMLPLVWYENQAYWCDGRLRELRNVHDIGDRIEFDRFPHEGPDIIAMKRVEKVEEEE